MIQQLIYRGTPEGYRVVAISAGLVGKGLARSLQALSRMPANWTGRGAPVFSRTPMEGGVALMRTAVDPNGTRNHHISHIYYIPREDLPAFSRGVASTDRFEISYRDTRATDALPAIDAETWIDEKDKHINLACFPALFGNHAGLLARFLYALSQCAKPVQNRPIKGICALCPGDPADVSEAAYSAMEILLRIYPGLWNTGLGYRTLWTNPENNVQYPVFFATPECLSRREAVMNAGYLLIDTSGGTCAFGRGETPEPGDGNEQLAKALLSQSHEAAHEAVGVIRAEIDRIHRAEEAARFEAERRKKVQAQLAEQEKRRAEAERLEQARLKAEAEEAERKKRAEAARLEQARRQAEAQEAERQKRIEAQIAEQARKRLEAERAGQEKQRLAEKDAARKRDEAEAEAERLKLAEAEALKRMEAERQRRAEAEAEARAERQRQREEDARKRMEAERAEQDRRRAEAERLEQARREAEAQRAKPGVAAASQSPAAVIPEGCEDALLRSQRFTSLMHDQVFRARSQRDAEYMADQVSALLKRKDRAYRLVFLDTFLNYVVQNVQPAHAMGKSASQCEYIFAVASSMANECCWDALFHRTTLNGSSNAVYATAAHCIENLGRMARAEVSDPDVRQDLAEWQVSCAVFNGEPCDQQRLIDRLDCIEAMGKKRRMAYRQDLSILAVDCAKYIEAVDDRLFRCSLSAMFYANVRFNGLDLRLNTDNLDMLLDQIQNKSVARTYRNRLTQIFKVASGAWARG